MKSTLHINAKRDYSLQDIWFPPLSLVLTPAVPFPWPWYRPWPCYWPRPWLWPWFMTDPNPDLYPDDRSGLWPWSSSWPWPWPDPAPDSVITVVLTPAVPGLVTASVLIQSTTALYTGTKTDMYILPVMTRRPSTMVKRLPVIDNWIYQRNTSVA